ncbi:unnamed protein product, partial [Mesorhabditis belari]|uniref:Uncharacterized protein n=1 Tax=Mesorhabditis belari TaxID=2138241 RepID=A0AAF3FG58_9BILA
MPKNWTGIYVVIDVFLIAICCVIVVAFPLKHSKKALNKAKKMEKEENENKADG